MHAKVHLSRATRPVEAVTYQVYFDYQGTLHHQAVVANDHLDAIEVIQKQYAKSEARLVFKGLVPEHVWMA